MIHWIAGVAGLFALNGCNAPGKAIVEYPLPAAASLPHRIASGPAGAMWFTEQTGHRIGRMNAAGAIVEFALPSGGNPIGIAAGPDGNMWFTESPGHSIGRIDAAGKIAEFSTGLSAGGSPQAITKGPDGALWFTEDVESPDGKSAAKIGRITTSGTIAELALPDGSGVLNDMTSDAERVWFTMGFPANGIGSMDVRTHRVALFPLPDGTGFPEGIALGPAGDLWFTLPQDHRIGRMTPAGAMTTFAMPNRGDTTGSPSSIALGQDGAMWFTEFNQSRIGRISKAGTIAEFDDGITDGSSPDGIAFGPDGSLWFTEYDGNNIGRM
ncbi:MAG TPA: SMP-30/gluconolactonase/LRE family protein [Candidatus Acidoferrales bacterium]|jgi:virginiamycin B lyase|nr:SMP-30/gluconolactonase/LRE family protein [Candidatus Acidoferrales bacterium]